LSGLANIVFKYRGVLRLDTVRSKILVFAFLVTLIPSGLTAWWSYRQNRHALQEKISQELLSASSQGAREMDVWLKERLYDLRVFASSYEVTENLGRGGVRSSTRGRLDDYLNSVRERLSDYEELIVLDPQGRMVGTSASRAEPLTLPEDWARELSSNDALVGQASWDTTLNKGILVVAVPVQRADGRMVGALAARLNLRGAEEALRGFAPTTSGQMYLMTTDGVLIAGSTPGSAELMSTKLSQTMLDRLKAREGSLVDYRSVTGHDVVGSLRRVPRVHWRWWPRSPPRRRTGRFSASGTTASSSSARCCSV